MYLWEHKLLCYCFAFPDLFLSPQTFYIQPNESVIQINCFPNISGQVVLDHNGDEYTGENKECE